MSSFSPANRGPRFAEILFCRDSFFSYKRNFIFGEICVSDEISANRGPRLAGLKPGQFFSYKHPLIFILQCDSIHVQNQWDYYSLFVSQIYKSIVDLSFFYKRFYYSSH